MSSLMQPAKEVRFRGQNTIESTQKDYPHYCFTMLMLVVGLTFIPADSFNPTTFFALRVAPLKAFSNGQAVDSVAISPNNVYIVGENFTEDSSLIRVWELDTEHLLYTLTLDSYVRAMDIDAQSHYLALVTRSESVTVYDLATGELVREILPAQPMEPSPSLIYDLAFHPEEPLLAILRDRNVVLLTSVTTGAVLNKITVHPDPANPTAYAPVTAIAFSRDGTTFRAIMREGPIQLWDIVTGTPTKTTEFSDAVAASGLLTLSAFTFQADSSTLFIRHRKGIEIMEHRHC